jgi:hypothetical protein
MSYLLEETIKAITSEGKSTDSIEFVRIDDKHCSWEQFVQWTEDLEYNEGFGCCIINQKLMIVGKNWWLERHEYDGSEWWEFKQKPRKPRSDLMVEKDLYCERFRK